jgi:hypothetical protein
MRRYYIVSGILLIPPIIDFAVAAPVLVQEKRQAGIDVVRTSEDAITMFGKRGDDELNELWLKLFGRPESYFLPKPEESPAAHPSSSSPPSGPADGSMDVEQPPPSIPEEPSPVSGPDHASPSLGNELNELWVKLFGHPESRYFPNPGESPGARPSSSSPQSVPADGPTGVELPLPLIPKEPSPVSSPDHATRAGRDEICSSCHAHVVEREATRL